MKGHDVNCTYCRHRKVVLHSDKKHDTETCRLSGRACPHPYEGAEPRYCERFQQVDCICERCNS